MRGPETAAQRLISWIGERELVTWEQHREDADVLMITNAWPHPERPTYGPFVQATWEAMATRGVVSDVLFIRGYRGLRAYIAGALVALLMPVAHPGRYRLVHSHGGETALAARCSLKVPVLASYLGTDLLGSRIGGGRGTRIKCLLRSTLLGWHASLMSATTTKSAEMERCLPRVARARNTVIPDGVDRMRFRPGDRARACSEIGWDPMSLNILFAGRAEAVEKRLWLAEEVVAFARLELGELTLHVVSSVSPALMPRHYVAADCLLHTSASEGSSNVIKEALACDLPVVATACGDTALLLEGVAASRVCEADPGALAEALIEFLRTRQRSDGRARTEHLSAEAIAGRTLECYDALAPGDGAIASWQRGS